MNDVFVFMDRAQEWYAALLREHKEDAEQKVASVLREAAADENGCWVTPTVGPRKVRYRGHQDRAYRFVYCVTNAYPASRSEVVRHRCNNRRCVRPDHLTLGTRADNNRDDRGFRANGVNFGLL